ncbi:heat shock 70 kDa protein 12A-like [Mya arenaria]|uniref:heat shock 70 kDa protein 12A-like n=1 Tax=Mya arenaria TaxID=6604 RepID=UPI0022DEC0F9|nr:heat shock 70 kDa protein 12A-like [Mya arenaria]
MVPILVVGIDFGTTYSGWAYLLRSAFVDNPTKVIVRNWNGDQLMSSKAPTCLLIEPDGETFSAFGYDAENKYISLVEDGEHDKWYFFKRFKMQLYNTDIKRDMEIKDETGKKLKANIVFSVAIRFLKDDLLQVIEDRLKGDLKPEDISWVLTVPAIWDDSARQIMREAAESAGISSDKLIIALEPEAAAIYCRFLPMEISGQGGSLSTLETGSKVLVVDAGGGTVDIAVQEVAGSGSMKNIYKASGGDWGGTKVDDAYVTFVADIIGKDTIEEFKRSHMDDYVYMIRDFEMKKRGFDPLKINKSVIFRISATLPHIVKESKGKEIHDLITDSPFKSTVSITADKLRVDKNVVKNLIENQADAIVDHVSSLLDQSTKDDIGTIVLVGGFNTCQLLQQAMKTKFDKHKIIIPTDPDLAVLKGAVIFGHKPELISQRVSKYSYGVNVRAVFIKKFHRETYKVKDEDGGDRCENVFDKHITAGQCLTVGEEQVSMYYSIATSSQTTGPIRVYYTLDPDPMYVTDGGCHLAGTLNVPLEGRGTNRTIKARLIYGGTEIDVEATEVATGKVHRLKIDFLS